MTFFSLLGAAFHELAALRRRAVRDALAAAFVTGLHRTALSAVLVAALLGVTLFQFVLPLLPWFGSRPDRLARLFLFVVQHLGDVLASVLVVGQAGLAVTGELWQARTRHRFTSVAAAGMDPLAIFVLPHVWGLLALDFFVRALFKATAVTVAVYGSLAWDGRFFGPEIGAVLADSGAAILAGYAVNAGLALLIAVACCAPALATPAAAESGPPLGAVFRRCLVLIFAAKLASFVV